MIPIDLILVRHGQSEGNEVLHRLRHGDNSGLTEAFLRRHSSKWRLTDTGIAQAKISGEWLKKNKLGTFDRYYVSDFLRAKETAAYLNLTNACWYTESLICEREFGEIDPTSGCYIIDSFGKTKESTTDLFIRIDRFLKTLYQECEGKRVIVVSHGEVMWTFRLLLEHMTLERWEQLRLSPDPCDLINNGQILHYTRCNPQTGTMTSNFNWLRSICPNNDIWSRPGWMTIVRQMLSNKELLSDVEKCPRICEPE